MRRLLKTAPVILYTLAVLISALGAGGLLPTPDRAPHYDVIVYGGGFAGCAAARQAAEQLPENARLLMVVPERALGSIGTAGGQNFFDLRRWNKQVVTQGSLAEWLAAFGQGYPTGAMADRLYRDVVAAHRDRLDILTQTELEDVAADRHGWITGLTVRPVRYDPDARAVTWAGAPTRFRGDVFIDASDTGRLARLAGAPLTSGREDIAGDLHQQAATLTFQLRGVDIEAAQAWRGPDGKPEFFFSQDADGTWVGYGGAAFVWNDPVISAYNKSSHPFTIKGYSIAENTPGIWWVNVLLMHNVDGRQQELDRGTPRWPDKAVPGAVSTDEAMTLLRAEVAGPRFLTALRRFPGFAQAEVVRDAADRPITADILYLRETVHGRIPGGFALTGEEVRRAGIAPRTGGDSRNYAERIGLGFYWIDINAYLKGEAVQTMEAPPNPVCIPFGVLVNPAVPNLLTPGYAQSTDSTAWAAMRVIPNLTVCGDAAGIAAAQSLRTGRAPAMLTPEDIAVIQQKLRAAGARLEK